MQTLLHKPSRVSTPAAAAAMAATSSSRPAALLALPLARPATQRERISTTSRRPQSLPNPRRACWRTWPAARPAAAAAAAAAARGSARSGPFAAASPSTSASTSVSGSTGGVPESKEEAVAQAAAALKNALDSKRSVKRSSKSRGTGGGAGFSKQPSSPSPQQQRRLSVELPLADVSPEAAAELLVDLVRPLAIAQDPSASLCIVSTDSRTLAACTQRLSSVAGNIRAKSIGVLLNGGGNDNDVAQQQSNIVFLIAPDSTHEASIASFLTTTASGTTIIAIAPQFPPDSYAQSDSIASSFEAVYCFLPLQIQGFFSRMEGAVVRAYGGSGPVGGTNWRMYVKDAAGDMKMITQLPKRPEPGQIETVFYNYVGMESPLTKAAKAIKSSLPFGGGAGKSKR